VLLSYSISSGTLGSPDLLSSYSITTMALDHTIILIIIPKSTNQLINTGTNAPDCASRNRHNCKKIENTCGKCKDNYFGKLGPSNNKCVSEIKLRENANAGETSLV